MITISTKFSFRPILAYLFMASFVVFVAVFVWQAQADKAVDAERADIQLRQSIMELRLSRLESEATASKRDLEIKIRELNDRQGATERFRAGSAPFATGPAAAAVVEVVCLDSGRADAYFTASGTVVDDHGLIVTNRHLLETEEGIVTRYCGVGFTIDQKLAPKIDYIATTVALHASTDLAVLQLTERLDGEPLPDKFPAVSIAGAGEATAALELGDAIWIGGYPGIGAETFTFTQGVVSGRVGDGLIKTSALIDSGTSGGAAFDAQGRYVGVPTAAVRGEIGGSLGYLIGADIVVFLLDDFYARRSGVVGTAAD